MSQCHVITLPINALLIYSGPTSLAPGPNFGVHLSFTLAFPLARSSGVAGSGSTASVPSPLLGGGLEGLEGGLAEEVEVVGGVLVGWGKLRGFGAQRERVGGQ